jgi:hypothetical protein
MPRSYDELLSDDPAWPELAGRAAAAPNGAVVLPATSKEQQRSCLEVLQMSTRSTLGAICHETGGILVDKGFLRMFGSGSTRLPRRICDWNAELGIELDRYIIVADDIVGGVFAIDGNELGRVPGRVHYFAPDSLEWEDTDLGHTDFVSWAFEGDLASFYASMRWPGWEKEIATLAGDEALSIVPPMWTEGKKPIAKRQRLAVPAKQLWHLYQELAAGAKPS